MNEATLTSASLPEVMTALGTRARRTAFRKLKDMAARTSYSHRGRYYTSRRWAERMWRRWYGWAIRSRLGPIKRVARMIKPHWDG